MTKFDELINNLKRDIQSLPSIDGSTMPKQEPTFCAIENTVSPSVIHHNNNTIVIGGGECKKNKYLKIFVRYGLLSVEFFIFFFILLSITKPSFLYYNERVIQNGRELLRTHFSFLYLFSYSIFFTFIFHILILIHQDLVKRY